MEKLQAGSIYSSVEVQDNTAKGFRSAQSNMKSFQRSAKELQDKLFPIQNALKGGMFAGASIAGTGAILSNFTIMGTVLQELTGNIPKMNAALQSTSGGTQALSNGMEQVAQSTETAFQKMVRFGIMVGSVSGIIFSGVEAMGKMCPVFTTLYENIRTSYQAWSSLIAMHREYAAVCTTSEAATEMLTAAGFRHITTTKINAAQTLLMTNTEAGSAVVKRVLTVCSWANIKATAAEIAAKVSLTGVTQSATAWTNLFSAATLKQTVLSTASTIKNIALTVSLGALGIAAKVAAVGVTALSAACMLSPMGLFIGALLVAGAAMVYLCGWFSSSSNAADENSEALQRNAEAMRANSEAMTKRNEIADTFDKTEELRLKRLEQLAQKENKSSAEMREAAKLTEDLNRSCAGLGLTFDETTGKVEGLNENTARILQDGNIRQRMERLKQELQYLKAELKQPGVTPQRKEEIWERQEKINRQLSVYKMGYADDVMGMSEAEYLQKRIDLEQKATDETTRIRSDAAKKQLEEYQKKYQDALDTVANLKKETRRNERNALENELVMLREQTAERRKFLTETIKAKEAAGESFAKEAEVLAKLNSLQTKRKTQIRDQYAADAKRYFEDFMASESERESKEAQKVREKNLDRELKENPLEGLKTVKEYLVHAQRNAYDSRWSVENKIASAQQDGIVTEKEAQDIQSARKKYQEQLQNVEFFKGKLESTKETIGQEVLEFQKNLSQPTAPLEAFSRHSVEAFKKEKELDGMSQSPETKKLGDIQKLLEAKYARETKIAEENRDLTRQLVYNIAGV